MQGMNLRVKNSFSPNWKLQLYLDPSKKTILKYVLCLHMDYLLDLETYTCSFLGNMGERQRTHLQPSV